MPSRDGHLKETEHFEASLVPEEALTAHAAGCPACSRRIKGLAAGREHLGDLEALALSARETSPLVPPPSLSSLGRTLAESEALVRAAENGAETLVACLAEAAARPGFPVVALHATQIASRLPLRRPHDALDFAVAFRAALPLPVVGESATLRMTRAELKVLESQGLLYVGESREACRLAAEGLAGLEENGAPLLLLSRARYYTGSALWGDTRYTEASALLVQARDGFAEDGQDAWVGRAQAAIGLVHFSKARFRQALHAFDAALERLDPAVDPGPVSSTQQNRAGILMNFGRLAEARAAFGQALALALRAGLSASGTTIRVNLLNLGLDEGAWDEVRSRGEKLVTHCDREGLAVDGYYARLALAEAQAALGNYGAVRVLVEALRGDAPPEVREDPDATALLSRLDAGDEEVSHRIRRLRHYLSGRDRAEAARRA